MDKLVGEKGTSGGIDKFTHRSYIWHHDGNKATTRQGKASSVAIDTADDKAIKVWVSYTTEVF